ncbi:hypothetical protein [Consotaella salsifontis]|uniref:Uncharacterized protein n=1 Tax=Consotaella salsifontis TaxID=1365950 RepID=A0A1T4NQY7_9HYPH|nr:hypothetical protein [Consotaella salsifontis]SJZ81516.1 hypothetical protein SAMN05428963_103133 [Consotaella salsifontis]
MISSLVDVTLLGALLFTSWRTATMYRELKRVRQAGSDLEEALKAADRTINGAAHTVVTLKHEGLKTLKTLEARCAEAEGAAARLEDLVARAEWHCSGQGARPQESIVVSGPWAAGEARHRVPASHQPRIVDQTV